MDIFFVMKGMFSINSKKAEIISAKECRLINGNKVIWHYESGKTLICYYGNYNDKDYINTLKSIGMDIDKSTEV